ncbi:hypothetical protein CEXT_113151 [Caerostris extrusa]|uniref:Uncharacterized protein n=1 Tax=Caerostris extrusa TaxID=172846 RepID=A0AAV4TFU3_CAEEX|nr:hypothetical protein CEXT_113151 [Caerostris extrusa]
MSRLSLNGILFHLMDPRCATASLDSRFAIMQLNDPHQEGDFDCYDWWSRVLVKAIPCFCCWVKGLRKVTFGRLQEKGV